MSSEYWDSIANTYHTEILSPFAPEMTLPDAGGQSRNVLLNIFRAQAQKLKGAHILDIGCGPGNLLEHIAQYHPKSLTGIDLSDKALELARQKARTMQVPFTGLRQDIREYRPDGKFDVTISVNSILPTNRTDIGDMLQSIRRLTDKNGEFWGILPSFDTIGHLLACMEEELTAGVGAEQAKADIEAFKERHQYDPVNLAYSDDGQVIQCYHTPDSIRSDFHAAGFHIMEMEKVYYPWALCARHDYGYYPDKEEIWDWLVIAKPV